MRTLIIKLLAGALAAGLAVAVPRESQAQVVIQAGRGGNWNRDGYWNNYWRWYDGRYRNYYNRGYYGSYPGYNRGYYGNRDYFYGGGYRPYGGYYRGNAVQIGPVGVYWR